MKKFTVTGNHANIHSGCVGLTAHQAGLRTQNLRHLEGNQYEVVSAIQFKHGEVFEYSGELHKGTADVEEVVETPQPEEKKVEDVPESTFENNLVFDPKPADHIADEDATPHHAHHSYKKKK